jgi:hypothetical protein
VLRLFQPDRDPADIKPTRTYARRTRYFARNELSRLCMDVLRGADGALLATDDIAGRVIEARGFDAADAALRKAIGEQCLALLRSFKKRGQEARDGRADRPAARGEVEPCTGDLIPEIRKRFSFLTF